MRLITGNSAGHSVKNALRGESQEAFFHLIAPCQFELDGRARLTFRKPLDVCAVRRGIQLCAASQNGESNRLPF